MKFPLLLLFCPLLVLAQPKIEFRPSSEFSITNLAINSNPGQLFVEHGWLQQELGDRTLLVFGVEIANRGNGSFAFTGDTIKVMSQVMIQGFWEASLSNGTNVFERFGTCDFKWPNPVKFEIKPGRVIRSQNSFCGGFLDITDAKDGIYDFTIRVAPKPHWDLAVFTGAKAIQIRIQQGKVCVQKAAEKKKPKKTAPPSWVLVKYNNGLKVMPPKLP